MTFHGSLRASGGFTLVELLIVLAGIAVIFVLAFTGFRRFGEASVARGAADVVSTDVTLTRSYAIQRRENVSLVVDALNRAYVIRTPAGDTLATRDFGAGRDLPLTLLEISPGDSLTFNARGVLTGGGTPSLTVARFQDSVRVDVNALGRSRLVAP